MTPHPSRSTAVALAALTVAAALAGLAAPPAGADSTTVTGAKLPSGRAYSSAVWDGTHAFVFGGENSGGRLNEIVRVTPSTESATTMGPRLPTARTGTSAAFDGRYAYIFGGFDGPMFDVIVRYDTVGNSVASLGARLPTPRYDTSAVWTGTHALIFGGFDGTDLNQIVRYHPGSGEVKIMNARLPFGRAATAAVWDGQHAYVFGGTYGTSNGYVSTDEIVRYDPVADRVDLMATKLPTARFLMGATWSGTHAYLFGGVNHLLGSYDTIMRYDPATGVIEVSDAKMSTKREGPVAWWANGRGYTAGGAYFRQGWQYLDQVVRFDLTPPGPPRNVTATAGPAVGEISLTWDAPASSGSEPITAYRVYGGDTAAADTLLAELGATARSFKESGLAYGKTRHYRVSAVSDVGEGEKSAASAATTFSLPTEPRNAATSRGPGAGEITLTWDAPASTGSHPIGDFLVYGGDSADALSLLARVGTARTFTESGLAEGAARVYRVSAETFVGEGPQSAAVEGRAPERPSPPRDVDAKPGPNFWQITVSWSAPESDGGLPVTGYRVYRGSSPDDLTLHAEVGASETSYRDSNLPFLEVYHYRIAAVNTVGEGAASASDCSASYPWHFVPTTRPAVLPACG